MVELVIIWQKLVFTNIINILENKWKCEYNEERNERYKNIQLEFFQMKSLK